MKSSRSLRTRTWHHPGINRGFVDFSEKAGHTLHRHFSDTTQTADRRARVLIESGSKTNKTMNVNVFWNIGQNISF